MKMYKYCNTCGSFKTCVYRGIINPCNEWRPDASHRVLRQKAQEIVGKPMSFKEAQFVESATTLEFFTPKQAGWLRSIHQRV